MVLQALAHLGQVLHRGHAFGLQQRAIAQTRELQQLWRVDRAARQDNFFVCLEVHAAPAHGARHANGGAAFEQHAVDHGAGGHGEVAAVHHRAQKRIRGGCAQAVANRHLPQAEALFARAVEVVGQAITQALAHLQKAAANRVHLVGKVAHPQFAARAVVVGRAPHMVFGFFEIRQHIAPAPAGVARVAPVVKVALLAAHIDHGVERAAATQHLAAWPVRGTVAQRRVRLGGVHPVVLRVGECHAVTQRHLDQRAAVRAAGFQQ